MHGTSSRTKVSSMTRHADRPRTTITEIALLIVTPLPLIDLRKRKNKNIIQWHRIHASFEGIHRCPSTSHKIYKPSRSNGTHVSFEGTHHRCPSTSLKIKQPSSEIDPLASMCPWKLRFVCKIQVGVLKLCLEEKSISLVPNAIKENPMVLGRCSFETLWKLVLKFGCFHPS